MTIYDSIELTDQEKDAALLEARKKKYFHERHAAYWQVQEAVIKGKTKTTELIKRS
jgi:hypothetical protein